MVFGTLIRCRVCGEDVDVVCVPDGRYGDEVCMTCKAGEAWHGKAWRGEAGHGMAGAAWQGR